MATGEERMRILKMVADKQITADEGAKLLGALRTSSGEGPGKDAAAKARWLRVRVTDRSTGRTKLNVTIPVGLVDVGLKMGMRFVPEMADMDMGAVQEAINQGIQGRILEVDDDNDAERVEIFVE